MDADFVSSHNAQPDHAHAAAGSSCSPCQNAVCWPVIIFIVLAIIVLIGILFSSKLDGNAKAWTFFITLIWAIIWAAILWFFCRSGQQAIAWFFLLLPIAIAIFWALAVFLASATTNPQCVSKGMEVGKPCDTGCK